MPFTDLLVVVDDGRTCAARIAAAARLARDSDARLMGLLRRITVPVCVSP